MVLKNYALRIHRESMKRLKGTPVFDRYKNLKSDYRKKRKRVRKAYLEKVKATYKKEQPVIDVPLQLTGAPIKTEYSD